AAALLRPLSPETSDHDDLRLLWGKTNERLSQAMLSARVLERAHRGEVTACRIRGPHALTSGLDEGIKWWDTPSWECRSALAAGQGGVRAALLAVDGEHALTGGDDGTVKLWHLPSRACRQTLEGHTGPVTGLILGPALQNAITVSR